LHHRLRQADFGSYGTRRGNAGVMVRGTFANAKLSNALASKTGPFTTHLPTGEEMFIADASEKYQAAGAAKRTPQTAAAAPFLVFVSFATRPPHWRTCGAVHKTLGLSVIHRVVRRGTNQARRSWSSAAPSTLDVAV